MSHYLHVVPGRLRVKIPFINGEPTRAREMEALLGHLRGIASVAANSVTGSVLVHYESDQVTADEILDVLKRNGYFDESKVITNDQRIQNVAARVGQSIGKALFGLVIEKAFESSGLSLIAALI